MNKAKFDFIQDLMNKIFFSIFKLIDKVSNLIFF